MSKQIQGVNVVELQDSLWDTFKSLKAGELKPQSASAHARVAREVISAARLRMDILTQAGKALPKDMVDSANPPTSETPGLKVAG